jgi:hypothetical protein
MYLNKLITDIKNKDLLFLLHKIKKLEKQINYSKFMRHVNQLNLSELSIEYTTVKRKKKRSINSSILSQCSIQNLNFDNFINDPDLLYKKLMKKLLESDSLSSDYRLKIFINDKQKEYLYEFIYKNLQVFSQKIKKLEFDKTQSNRKKESIYKISNHFLYDQSFDNRVTKNFHKTRTSRIKSFLGLFFPVDDQNNSKEETDYDIFEYDQIWPNSIKRVDELRSSKISAMLK